MEKDQYNPDQPQHEQHMDRHSMLLRIQQLEFKAIELNLFLDTHPFDREPLKEYRMVVGDLLRLRSAYERMHGPLMPFSPYAAGEHMWRWIEEPWPWEIDYNPADPKISGNGG